MTDEQPVPMWDGVISPGPKRHVELPIDGIFLVLANPDQPVFWRVSETPGEDNRRITFDCPLGGKFRLWRFQNGWRPAGM